MSLTIEHAYIIYSMYRAGGVAVHRACCERATQPYSLAGRGTICPGSRDQHVVTTRSPRIITECLLTTGSMLIKLLCIHTPFTVDFAKELFCLSESMTEFINIESDES